MENRVISSSTSSSRAIYLKISLMLLVVFSLAMGIILLITHLANANAENIMGRALEAQKALPMIVEEERDLVMMYGSSMTEAGFSPRLFQKEVNAQGKNIKAFNFGFGGLNPYFQEIVSRRIVEAFEAKDRKLKLMIVEFNPFQTTKTRWNGAVPVVDSFLSILASDAELWEIAKQDPTRGALLFNIKYIRNDVSAETITSFFADKLFPTNTSPQAKEPQDLLDRRAELGEKLGEQFDKDNPDFNGENWHYGWQGGGTIPDERSEATVQLFKDYYATFQNDINKQNRRQFRINRADIEGLNFKPLLVESFVQIIKNFQQIADHVEVVMLPRNTQWIHYSPEARARLDSAIQQIEQGAGITIHDHQTIPEITPDMYSDVTHLTRYHGDVTYTRFLAKQFVDSL